MIYKLEMKIRPDPLLPWYSVFSALSIKQFSQVYDKLDFPFDPPEPVRQLAHDFALTIELLSRNSEYANRLEILLRQGEKASINLLEGTLPDDQYIKRRDTLFTNTFMHLERMGYAEAVYKWVKQTRRYYKFTNRERYTDFDALDSWCHLLRKWAVTEWMKQPVLPEHIPQGLYSANWDKLIAKFAPIYERGNRILEYLPLSQSAHAILQAIVLHHETKKLCVTTTTDQMMVSPQSMWEEFALGPGGSYLLFQLEAPFRISLCQWNMILDALSADEMNILNQWALKDPNPHRNLKVPLPDFRLEHA